MNLSSETQKIYSQIDSDSTKLGDLRKIAKEIKKDHGMAMELWSTGEVLPRQLSILIMDKKMLTQNLIDELVAGIEKHPSEEKLHLMEWLMANQLMKDKKTIALIESWEEDKNSLLRRTFWYYQARLRWTGKVLSNNEEVLQKIEYRIASEAEEVQWAMNFTAGWIGVFDESLRERCIAIGEKTALYKDEVVAKGCTPSYLPEFISIEVGKRNK